MRRACLDRVDDHVSDKRICRCNGSRERNPNAYRYGRQTVALRNIGKILLDGLAIRRPLQVHPLEYGTQVSSSIQGDLHVKRLNSLDQAGKHGAQIRPLGEQRIEPRRPFARRGDMTHAQAEQLEHAAKLVGHGVPQCHQLRAYLQRQLVDGGSSRLA